jgi:glycine cleavage system aminomethyltransferase T/glycine/D-amino acid oxidase-like deaminating enzyme
VRVAAAVSEANASGETPSESAPPDRARVVIVGGGVAGVSIAYHLAELGETDVVVVDRDELTSGSTFHSAGLVGQLRADPTLTRMNMYSVELYRSLQQTENPPGWVESGGIKLASSPDRLEEIRRQISWAQTYGLPLDEISPAQARESFPLMSGNGVVGACVLESDGHVDAAQLCMSLAARARRAGVTVCTHTRVTAIETVDAAHGMRRVSVVRTDRGDIECEVVVDAAGMFAAEIGRMVGVRVPVVPLSHQYVVTEPVLEDTGGASRPTPLPSLRDPDLLVYFRQEVAGLVMGGYERNPAAWTAGRTSYDAIPADFNGRLLPEDWDRFEQIAENGAVRVPVMADVGVRALVNGPEAFTPDNEFCLGETSVAGFFVAAGFCAHGIAGAGGIGKVMAEWIVAGEPEFDVWHMDIGRFGSAYASPSYTLARALETYQTYYDIKYPLLEPTAGRPLRTSPAYAWHADHGAVFGEKAGWERVNYYAPNSSDADERWRPRGWAGRDWSTATAAEHRATRTTAGLFDETSFAKIEVLGRDAAAFLEKVCDNHVARAVGDVTYTQALNSRGGIEADFTVTRVDEDRFRIITGTAYGSHDMAWLRRQARVTASDVDVTDVTGALACFALWGPHARAILASLTPTDVSESAFPFLTSQQISVGDVPVRALRVSFTGEDGWELYTSTEYGRALWDRLVFAGAEHGMLPCGYRALESLRLERGYRVWSTDITPETNPYEAGLGFCVKLDKPGGFVGDAALAAARSAGASRKLCLLVLDDPLAVVLGSEPVLASGSVVGRVTSGGFGYTCERSLAYGYLPVGIADQGTRVQVNMFGTEVPATVTPVRSLRTAHPSPAAV